MVVLQASCGRLVAYSLEYAVGVYIYVRLPFGLCKLNKIRSIWANSHTITTGIATFLGGGATHTASPLHHASSRSESAANYRKLVDTAANAAEGRCNCAL